MATLIVLQGPDKGRRFQTSNEPALLGRNSDQIPLTDNTVSRRHAELRPQDGAWVLEDLHSSNGTYVNGQRIKGPVRLKHGDQIKVGSTLLVYGGEEPVQKLSGKRIPRDLISLDVGSKQMDSAILSSIPSNEDSVVIAAPETAEAAHAWRAMSQLLEAIGAIASPDQLLERVMDIIFEEVPVDRGFVLMLDPDTGEPVPRVVRYRAKSAPRTGQITTSRTIIDHVIQNKESVLCANAMTDERFTAARKSGSIQDYGLQSVICVPIVGREEILGVIHIDCSMSSHTYTQEQLRLITAIGRATGMAIQNARLVESRMQSERLAATGEAVAYVSHYIKNILQGLRGGADVVQIGLKRKHLATIEQGWQIVQRNLAKIYNLTTNMLAFSKSREPRLVMAQLNGPVREAIELVQAPADGRGVMVLAELDESLPPAPIDVDGIHQVALNILTNAVEACPRSRGVVNVKTEYDPKTEEAVLTISDNGSGIPPDQLHQIFEPFHSTKGQGGTGLGLAVARKIVQEHNGRIHVRSRPQEGTTFIIRLPTSHGEALDSAETHGPDASERE